MINGYARVFKLSCLIDSSWRMVDVVTSITVSLYLFTALSHRL